jgi:DNA repair exonuclease SbcCD ATPase subunit
VRLRVIELTNVRRFAGQRARLGQIGDGITVLSQPNEFGKSTFFDALHALFFERHNSRNAAIKALQPHAGGAPEVAAEVDLAEGRFRIAKRWLNRPQAQVQDATGRLIAQADEAEAWIDRLMGGGLAGPSGLLWVRQGLMGLEPDGSSTDDKRERERGLSARRDILSSVAGEIDMMTGGRRMDTVIDRVSDALTRLATSTGRPKAGGEWARAVEEAGTLATEEAELRPRADRLSVDLIRRAEVQRSLARLTDPTDSAARAQTLAQAEAAHQAAQAHQAEVAKSETALRLARLDAEHLQRDVQAAETRAARLEEARASLTKAQEAATKARTRAADLTERDRVATESAEALAVKARDLRNRLQQASRAQAAHAARIKADDLQRRLDRATELQAMLDKTQAARARIRVTAKLLDAADKAQSALDLARARAEAQAVTIEAHPDGPAALRDGQPLPAGSVPILAETEITLPGFGRLHINPGRARGADSAAEMTRADQDLARLLAEAQVDTLTSARSQWAEAQRLDAEAKEGAALRAEVAPEGVDPLRAALAQARADAVDVPQAAEDVATLTKALTAAEAEEQIARAEAKTAHDLAVTAGETRAAAEANHKSAERQFASALSEAGDPDALAALLAELKTRQPALASACVGAEGALDRLRATAPDLATTEARLTRARGAVEQAARDLAKAREDLASLNATIAALAEEGIEERLASLAEARAEAEAGAARYEAEVRALTRLRRALDEARTLARDAYFGPVLRELQPLLSILYPGAQLTIDDTSLLPATLTRNGQAESLDILSGGTREQVAILTRLAFARLFAASGRPVPVILDDALVHSDDDRIEAMFDALHRTGRDQQILVLTCRQRAFAALGGTRAEVTIDAT